MAAVCWSFAVAFRRRSLLGLWILLSLGCPFPFGGLIIYPQHDDLGTTFHESQPLPPAPFAASAEAMGLTATGPDELHRAQRRAGVQLVANRTVKPQTRTRRQALLDEFEIWMVQAGGISLAELVDVRDADPETSASGLCSMASWKSLWTLHRNNQCDCSQTANLAQEVDMSMEPGLCVGC